MTDFVRDFEIAVYDGFGLGMDDTRREALRLSSGPFSQPELDAMDNPYARRHGTALLPPEIINRQKGEFYEHWHWPQLGKSGPDLYGRILNDSDVADFLRLGTRFMLPRPIEQELEIYAGPAIEHRVNRALRSWERKRYFFSN